MGNNMISISFTVPNEDISGAILALEEALPGLKNARQCVVNGSIRVANDKVDAVLRAMYPLSKDLKAEKTSATDDQGLEDAVAKAIAAADNLEARVAAKANKAAAKFMNQLAGFLDSF